MDSTLQKIRQVFINSYQAGFDKEDRKIQSGFIDELVFQARATILKQERTFNSQCLQKKAINITKVVEKTGFYFKADIPTICEILGGPGVFVIKAATRNMNIEIPFEKVSLNKFFQHKHDRYNADKTKVAISGNELLIRTKETLPTAIDLYAVFYNPFAGDGFVETSPFPFIAGMNTQLISVMYDVYLTKIGIQKENANNSKEEIIAMPPKERQQQQE